MHPGRNVHHPSAPERFSAPLPEGFSRRATAPALLDWRAHALPNIPVPSRHIAREETCIQRVSEDLRPRCLSADQGADDEVRDAR